MENKIPIALRRKVLARFQECFLGQALRAVCMELARSAYLTRQRTMTVVEFPRKGLGPLKEEYAARSAACTAALDAEHAVYERQPKGGIKAL